MKFQPFSNLPNPGLRSLIGVFDSQGERYTDSGNFNEFRPPDLFVRESSDEREPTFSNTANRYQTFSRPFDEKFHNFGFRGWHSTPPNPNLEGSMVDHLVLDPHLSPSSLASQSIDTAIFVPDGNLFCLFSTSTLAIIIITQSSPDRFTLPFWKPPEPDLIYPNFDEFRTLPHDFWTDHGRTPYQNFVSTIRPFSHHFRTDFRTMLQPFHPCFFSSSHLDVLRVFDMTELSDSLEFVMEGSIGAMYFMLLHGVSNPVPDPLACWDWDLGGLNLVPHPLACWDWDRGDLNLGPGTFYIWKVHGRSAFGKADGQFKPWMALPGFCFVLPFMASDCQMGFNGNVGQSI